MECFGQILVPPSCSAHQAGLAEYHLIKELAPKETFLDKTVYFRPKQPFSAKNYVTAEWPKPANNAETVSAEN